MAEPAHPVSYEDLIALFAGELDLAEASRVAEHVVACPACQASARRLRLIVAYLREGDLRPPPAPTLARARSIFRQHRTRLPARLADALPRLRLQTRSAVAAILLALALSISAVRTVAARSQHALPGEPLYPVKTMIEDVQLALSLDGAVRTRLYLTFASARVEEIMALAARGQYQAIPASITDLEVNIEGAASSVKTVAEHDTRLGISLARQIETSLSESSRVLISMHQASPDEARPILAHAVNVCEAGKSIVRAQLPAQTLLAMAQTETPSARPGEPATPTPTAASAAHASGPTDQPAAPTATPLPPPATSAPASTPTSAPPNTAVPEPTETHTPAPSDTARPTATPTPSATRTATVTASPVPSNTPTPTASATSTETAVPTDTPSPTATDTDTPTPTATATDTDTPTPTATPSPTETRPGRRTKTPTPTPTWHWSPTPTPTDFGSTSTPTPTTTGEPPHKP